MPSCLSKKKIMQINVDITKSLLDQLRKNLVLNLSSFNSINLKCYKTLAETINKVLSF